jgi:uncharacterized protein (TIGR03437 family)
LLTPANIPSKVIQGKPRGEETDFILDNGNNISLELAGYEDPPRQDYRIIATPEKFTAPTPEPVPGYPPARAAAADALIDALLDYIAKLRAAKITLDRMAGAALSSDQEWASLQAAAFSRYKKQWGEAALVVSNRLEALVAQLRSEGIQDIIVSADTIRAYQQRLRSEGFNADELQAARLLRLTDEEIEEVRQDRLAADPDQMAGSLMTGMERAAAAFREMGKILTEPPVYYGGGPPIAVLAAPGGDQLLAPDGSRHAAADSQSKLTRVFATNFRFQVGNPLPQTAAVELRTRTVDLPPDWTVTLSPAKVTLAPGKLATVTATVQARGPAVQGTRYRAAVEGYSGGQLLGGVVLDVLVPEVVPFAIGPAPRVSSGGVVNAASFLPAIAPGSLITVFGSDLASTTASASSTPLPQTLGGLSITVNGRAIPLVYASPTQINAQMPYEIAPGPATLIVYARGVAGDPVPITVGRSAPGIFQWGDKRAVVQNQDFSLNTPQKPAAVGSVIVAYLTGQGALDNAVTTGAAAPANPLSKAALPVAATLGGKPADVLFAGLTPGFVGLLQVNLKVPGLGAGDHPLVITLGGVASNPALVAVSGN